MRILLSALAIVALSGCGESPQETKIADINFADQASVHHVAQRLQPKDREAFLDYARRRTTAEAARTKEPLMPDGKRPLTIRDAEQLAIEAQNKEEAHSKLTAKRNDLVDRKNKLIGPEGTIGGKAVTEWNDLGNAIDAVDKRIAALDD